MRIKFSWGGFFQWHVVVICVWCALFVTSHSCFQAKFIDIIGIFFYTHSPYFCKNQALYTPLITKFLQNIKLKRGDPKPPPLRTPLVFKHVTKISPNHARSSMSTLNTNVCLQSVPLPKRVHQSKFQAFLKYCACDARAVTHRNLFPAITFLHTFICSHANQSAMLHNICS